VSTSPYQFDWSGVAAGSYSINAIAYDNNGAQATSSSRTITVAATNTAPSVSLTAPADGARYLNPTSITISASAHPAGRFLSKRDVGEHDHAGALQL